jgi:hypothetical protein
MIVRYEILKTKDSLSVYAVHSDDSWSLSAFVEKDFTLEQLAQEFYEVLATIGNHEVVMRDV